MMNEFFTSLGNFVAEFFRYCVNGVFQMTQWMANLLLDFLFGILIGLLSDMPGFSSEEAYATANALRTEIAKWNMLFPVYETILCLNAIINFKILVSLYRSLMTIWFNAANLATLRGSWLPGKGKK